MWELSTLICAQSVLLANTLRCLLDLSLMSKLLSQGFGFFREAREHVEEQSVS